MVPYQVFDASDGIFALAVGNDRMFVDLCEQVVGLPALARDPRFVTAHQRALHRDDLLPALSAAMLLQSCDHWIAACTRAGVPAGRVKTVAEALQSPSVTERGVVEVLDHPTLGPVSLIRAAHGLEAQVGRKAKAPPLLGQDTRAVLTGVLGLDEARIAALVQAGAVACLDLEG